MSRANGYIQSFTEEDFGRLHTTAEPFNYDEAGDRWRVEFCGIKNGIPGYVACGKMSEEEAAAYITKKENPRLPTPRGRPLARRQVSLYAHDENTRGGIGELVGVAIYGKSVNPYAESLEQLGILCAHVPTFCIAGETASGEALPYQNIYPALGYATLLDMKANGFQEVSYNLETARWNEFQAEAEALGIWSTLKKNRDINNFPIPVQDPEAVRRTELMIDVPTLQGAFTGLHPWLIGK